MKLSKDQKQILKTLLMYAVAFTVLNPPIQWLFRKTAIHLKDFLYAGIVAFGVCIIVGLLLVVGSHVPTKDD